MSATDFFTKEKKKKIKRKYIVKWFTDIFDYRDSVNKSVILSKPIKQILLNHTQNYDFKNNIPVFKNLLDKNNELNIENLLHKYAYKNKNIHFKSIRNNLNITVIKKGQYIFKGTRYFYDNEYEKLYLKENKNQLTWFGDLKIAFSYTNRYQGGLNSYKIKKKLNLINIYDYNNLIILMKLTNNKTILDAFNLKYGLDLKYYNIDVDINNNSDNNKRKKFKILDQIRLILNYNNARGMNWRNEIWLNPTYEKLDDIKYDNRLNVYGAGHNDRIIAEYIKSITKGEIDGWYSPPIYTPFSLGNLSGEILLFDFNNITRDTTNKFDWIQWQKHLPIKIPNDKKFMLNNTFRANGDFRLLKHYFDHNKKLILPKSDFKIITFNCHYFVSINVLDTEDDCYNNFINLLNKSLPDIFSIQEFPKKYLKKLKTYIEKNLKNYNLLYTNNGSNNDSLLCILLTTHKIVDHKLINYLENKKNRNYIVANININNTIVKVIACHMPIGYRYLEFNNLETITNTYHKNVNIRAKYLFSILKHKPNIILGDFNFTPIDNEKKIIYTSKFKKSFNIIKNSIEKTSIDTVVDYILLNKNFKYTKYKYMTLNYPYSDHLPLLLYVY